jgi:hypothetical protein
MATPTTCGSSSRTMTPSTRPMQPWTGLRTTKVSMSCPGLPSPPTSAP